MPPMSTPFSQSARLMPYPSASFARKKPWVTAYLAKRYANPTSMKTVCNPKYGPSTQGFPLTAESSGA